MRTRLKASLLALLMLPAVAARAEPAYETLSVAELQSAMTSRLLTAKTLTEYFLTRIEALDRHGPRLNSVIEVNPQALSIAAALDEERDRGASRGPLHGIPVLLKDNIDTIDPMFTTAGSLALLGSHPARDATLAKRLRDAGAVILGKTNLSEWANFRSSRSVSGWSGRGGLTRNPWATDRNPCGSSSGSGAAMAAGFAALTVGTETDGSIVCPSSVNGVVGIKPTLGLVSRSGVIPIAASQDTAGPMAHSLADAVILLRTMAASDPTDAATAAIPAGFVERLALPPAGGDLKGVRIGVARNMAGFHEGVDGVFETALQTLRAAGAELVDVELKLGPKVGDDEFTVLLYEFKDGINRYLPGRSSGPRTLADLIAFNNAFGTLEMPYFGQETFMKAQEKGPLTDKAYRDALSRAKKAAGKDGIEAVIKKSRVQALVAPTLGPAWTTDMVNGDHVLDGGSSQAAAIAGYPHITVPAGLVHGLPVGVSFIGGAWTEPELIRVAAAFEYGRGAWQGPVLR